MNLPAGKALRVTTSGTDKGKTTDLLEYVVQDGVREFVVAFTSPQAKYASFLAAYGHAISTFTIG